MEVAMTWDTNQGWCGERVLHTVVSSQMSIFIILMLSDNNVPQ